MNLSELIKEIAKFSEEETQKLVAELEQKRFENRGAFNGHQQWQSNNPAVAREKGFNQPLVDTGNLKKELTNPKNWDLKPKFSGNKLTLTIPDRENFTSPKYDVLDTGGVVDPYIGRRSGKLINIHSVPARPFKNISIQDANWIASKLSESIQIKFGE